MDSVVLLLNSNYEPLNVCDVRRAFRLLFGEKAEVIEYDHHEIRTAREVFRAPSVIRLQYHIKRPRPRVRIPTGTARQRCAIQRAPSATVPHRSDCESRP
jgi:hypothetical protein